MPLNPHVATLTDRIRQRSRGSREAYLAQIREAASLTPHRCEVSCANLAHNRNIGSWRHSVPRRFV